MAKFLYTQYNNPSEPAAMVIDGAPVGPLGRLYIVPFDEVVEVPDIAADQLVEHMAYKGVVEVTTTKQRTGLVYNIEDAVERSKALIKFHDQRRFEGYVQGVIDDRVSRGKIVPPPSPGVRDIMERNHWRLEDYGVKPMGSVESQRDAELEALKVENAEFRIRMNAMMGQLEDLTREKAGTGVHAEGAESKPRKEKAGKAA